MRKKLFTLLIVLLIGLLTFSLVACADDFNYDGNVTVTVNLDKDYGDVIVNCPEGEIEKNSNVKYTIKLSSTLPVDIVLKCEGFEQITLRYTTEDLKNNSEITENISFQLELYRFTFYVQGVDIKLAQNYSGVALISQGSAYVLESEKPIKQDILLDAGDNYEQIILFKEMFKYVASKGKLITPIPVVNKNSNKVAVYVPGHETGNAYLTACDIEKYDNGNNNDALYYGKYNLVETRNYAVYSNYAQEKQLLKLTGYDKGYYCYGVGEGAQFEYKLFLKDDRSRVSNIKADYIISYYDNYDSFVIFTNRELAEGDIFVYDFYNSYTGGYLMRNVHIVNAKDVENRNIDLSEDESVDYLNDRKFVVNFKDSNGDKITFNYATIGGEFYEQDKIFLFSSTSNYIVHLYSQTTKYDDVFIDYLIIDALINNSDEDIVYIDYVPVAKKNFVVKYRNVITGQIIENITNTIYVIDGEIIENLEPTFKGYSLVNKDGIIYFEEIFGDSMVVDVMPTYEIKIKITNADLIEYEHNWQTFSTADGVLVFWPKDADATGYNKLDVSEMYAGKTLRFTFKTYTGEIKYYFDITIPENFAQSSVEERTFEVTITEVDNEW